MEKKQVFDKSRAIPLFIQVVCFACSAIISILLFRSLGVSPLSKNVLTALGVVCETSKLYFMFKTFDNDESLTKVLRSIYCCIGVSCFLVSITGTLIFSYNEAVKNINDISRNNALAAAQQKEASKNVESIKDLKTKIASMETEKTTIVNNLPRLNKSERAATAESYNKKIEKLNDTLAKLESTKFSTAEIITEKQNDSGTGSFFSDWKPFNMPFDKFFLVFISFLTEFIGIFSHIEYMRNKDKILVQYTQYENAIAASQIFQQQSQLEPVTARKSKPARNTDSDSVPKVARKIGFEFSTDDLTSYKNYMYNNLRHDKEGKPKSIGYKSIANAINIDHEVARKIKDHLEMSGELETVGSTTYIIK